jgi:hypothetical protein
MLNSGKTVEEVREIQLSHIGTKKAPPKKKVVAPPPPPKKQAKAAPPTKEEVETDEEVNEEAEQIFRQIRDAAKDIKTIGRDEDLQLNSDIKFTPEDELAIGYMAAQFPKEFPQDEIEEKMDTKQNAIAQESKDKQDMKDYSQQVAQEADSYNQNMI